MSTEEGNVGEMPEGRMEDSSLQHEKQLAEVPHGSNENLATENGLHDGTQLMESTHEQLVQMVIELRFQNDFLKSQFEDLKNIQSKHDETHQETGVSGQKTGEYADVKELHERIESLNRELNEEKQTRGAAEEALKHLREVYSEADAKVQELSGKLAEGQSLFVHLEVLKICSIRSCLIMIVCRSS